ncbi:polysaccharide deacetylase [Nitrospira sp.]|nr:polysaccharide deacetylase [Nitrospira sp.]
MILLYHRIAEGGSDPWGLSVSPADFAEHLSVLSRFGTPMGLQEFLRQRRDSNARGRAIVVTIDDGFANNLLQAKPILHKYGIPATVFVTAGMIGRPGEFWWDELERHLLNPGTLPSDLTLTIGGQRYHWALEESAIYQECDFRTHFGWRAWHTTCPSKRHALYQTLYALLFRLEESARQAVLDELAEWAGGITRSARESHRLLTHDELARMIDGGAVEVGAHSLTHTALGALSPGQQWREIQEGKALLEDTIRKPVASFAFPFGRARDYSRETLALVRAAGFTCACTTIEDRVEAGADPFELPRFTVHPKDRLQFSAWMEGLLEQ